MSFPIVPETFPTEEEREEETTADIFAEDTSQRSARAARARRSKKKAKSSKWQDITPGVEEKLREHPIFNLDPFAVGEAGTVSSFGLRESEREKIYRRELLRMFKGRIQLVASIGLCMVPVFTAFFFLLVPQTSFTVAFIELFFFGLLGAFYLFGKHAVSLPLVRLAAQWGFIAFSVGNTALITVVGNDAGASSEISRAVQIIILASFIHILLAILLLPFTLPEAIRVALSSLIFMGFGLHFSLPIGHSWTFVAQIFVMVTTMSLILILSHLNARMRRRVFDSTFDMALQAKQMQEMSQTDTLTGSFNRRYIERILTLELARAARFRHELSILMFDLDNFKPVNDTLGHSAGDEVLKIVATSVSSMMREVDSFGRFGGDEFVVVLPETDREAALAMANRLRAHVAAQLWRECGADSLASKVTLSMGILTCRHAPLPDAAEALHLADSLLYSAKRRGKDCVVTG